MILIQRNNGLPFSALSMNLCSVEDTLVDYLFSVLVIHRRRADGDICESGISSV